MASCVWKSIPSSTWYLGEHHYLPANGAMALLCSRLTMNSSMGRRLMASPVYLSLSTHLWRTCNTEDKVCTESKAKELSMGSGLSECEIISGLGMRLHGRMLMMMVTVWIFGICPPTLKTAMTAHIECLSHQSSYKCWAILFGKYHMEAICYISCD